MKLEKELRAKERLEEFKNEQGKKELFRLKRVEESKKKKKSL